MRDTIQSFPLAIQCFGDTNHILFIDRTENIDGHNF